jgi:hypothetical protein
VTPLASPNVSALATKLPATKYPTELVTTATPAGA